MRKKIYDILNKLYGIVMTVAFFGGILPLVFFIVAIIVGGTTGEKIAVFMADEVYPVVIALASISVLIGWIAMYVGKEESLSVNEMKQKK